MRKRILLVEDDPLIAELLDMFLTVEGLDVSLSANGAEALTRLRTESFDVIVLDLMMPVLDGLGFLDELRKVGQTRSPILVFSASTSPEVVTRALAAGASAVARKPLEQEEFMGLIHQLLDY